MFVILVIKKNGQIQKFNLDKVRLSIERASDEAKTPLTASDINYVSKVIVKKLESIYLSPLQSNTIHKIVVKSLKDTGFKKVADYYKNYKTKT